MSHPWGRSLRFVSAPNYRFCQRSCSFSPWFMVRLAAFMAPPDTLTPQSPFFFARAPLYVDFATSRFRWVSLLEASVEPSSSPASPCASLLQSRGGTTGCVSQRDTLALRAGPCAGSLARSGLGSQACVPWSQDGWGPTVSGPACCARPWPWAPCRLAGETHTSQLLSQSRVPPAWPGGWEV